MSISTHAYNSGALSSNANQTVTLPAVSNGDCVIVVFAWGSPSVTVTPPSGYTAVPSTLVNGSSCSAQSFYHIWHTGDTTTPVFVLSIAEVACFSVATYTSSFGTFPSSPIDVSAVDFNSSSSTTENSPSVTPTRSADELIQTYATLSTSPVTVSAPSLGVLETQSGTASGPTTAIVDSLRSGTSATGAQQVTIPAAHTSAGAQIAIYDVAPAATLPLSLLRPRGQKKRITQTRTKKPLRSNLTIQRIAGITVPANITNVNEWTAAGSPGNVLSIATNTGAQIQVGDVLVASIADNTSGGTPPAGWSTAVPWWGISLSAGQTVYYKVAAAGDIGASFAFHTTNVYAAGGIKAFRGVDNANPIDAAGTGNSGTGTTITAASITPVYSGDALLWLESNDGTPIITIPVGENSAWNIAGVGSANYGSVTAYQLGLSSGPTGAISGSSSGSTDWTAVLVALKPAAIISNPPLLSNRFKQILKNKRNQWWNKKKREKKHKTLLQRVDDLAGSIALIYTISDITSSSDSLINQINIPPSGSDTSTSSDIEVPLLNLTLVISANSSSSDSSNAASGEIGTIPDSSSSSDSSNAISSGSGFISSNNSTMDSGSGQSGSTSLTSDATTPSEVRILSMNLGLAGLDSQDYSESQIVNININVSTEDLETISEIFQYLIKLILG